MDCRWPRVRKALVRSLFRGTSGVNSNAMKSFKHNKSAEIGSILFIRVPAC